ncbi:cytochrome c peroxidase [Advenella mimigardefordensis]|uniref:Methylamine utilization protein MauG n=1 Tax=Advenella mimigardefordensis (strain DSM 17166 / LMG 22922 / DPN7) TaxID=1247726 RepID=W0PGV0_ADVMD|nr:cytochrome c peroxidase [Advenella mimigardefordensis]AHG65037.1 methylamine utilization protein MauG [Advenella mimigardefordensis DPN7]
MIKGEKPSGHKWPGLILLAALLAGVQGSELRNAHSAPQADAEALRSLKQKYERPQAVPYPATNPYSQAKEELGRKLFFDTRLSRASRSCATCHDPGKRWSDGLVQPVGSEQQEFARKTPTLLNSAWLSALMWDGRADTLEQQAVMPITAEHEMNMPVELLVERINALADYRQPVQEAYGTVSQITVVHIQQALATFERTLVSPRTDLDRWIAGDQQALSAQEQRGFAIYNGEARCSACHSTWRLTDDGFHDIGLASADRGRGQFTPPQVVGMQYAFKTPTLRELNDQGPYMHDGSIDSLEAVITHYEEGGIDRPSRSPEMKPFTLTEQERADLLAFLRAIGRNPDSQAIDGMKEN